jgi:hypothetical protein
MGDRPGGFPGCALVRTKCAQKTRVGLWGQYMILESLSVLGLEQFGWVTDREVFPGAHE